MSCSRPVAPSDWPTNSTSNSSKETLMEINYLRGAFIAYEPGGYPDRNRTVNALFRFASTRKACRGN